MTVAIFILETKRAVCSMILRGAMFRCGFSWVVVCRRIRSTGDSCGRLLSFYFTSDNRSQIAVYESVVT